MSLNQMRTRISFGDLPQTFRDAITVVRKLVVRCLWIDAMCIIQNNGADWQSESSQMGLIYEQAICNIAVGTGNVETSLFRTREPKNVLPLKVDADFNMEGYRLSGPMYLVEHKYREHQLSKSNLHGRGWVVQERLLSPRALHFLPEQVLWEELMCNACEPFLFGCVQLANERDHGKHKTTDIIDRAFSSAMNLHTWDDLVRIYSATSLTKRRDKMVALQGLAQHWLNYMPRDRYCAGLWETTMPQCLQWKVADGRDCERNLQPYSAISCPRSWSWLSVNTKIKPYRYTLSGLEEAGYQAKILELNLTPEIPGCNLGDLKVGANIVIRGKLKSAKDMYWPMSSLNRSSQTADWSEIQACWSPINRVDCSIDDMPRFLAI